MDLVSPLDEAGHPGSEEILGVIARALVQELDEFSAEDLQLRDQAFPAEVLRGERRPRLARVIDEVEQVEAEAQSRGRPVLGERAVREQHPHTRPEHLKRRPRPLGHASTRQALKELRERYRAFVATFVPQIEVLFVGEPDPSTAPLGIKSVGEIGITGVAAAIANAVYNATGRRLRDLPLDLRAS